ncbi:MAG: type I-E CRISPR-associated protein Cas7/Cse4/CasC [Pirellulaceae bacterium]|nr:type I-E CRISPR-associated protein Cas7/Cse4/CasC [Pirellulaceae bacterium]
MNRIAKEISMKHLELHILQSVPVACLNRDDLNSPKTAVFGGVQRARVSSQSWKRAIRELAKEISPNRFQGERTRLLFEPLVQALIAKQVDETEADSVAKQIIDALVKLDAKSKDKVKSTTLYFMSPLEMKTIAEEYVQAKDVKKALKKIDSKALKDAADISLFGRMVATDHSLTVEASAMFSHALSTHKTNNEIDFFAAVDDLQPKDEAGAGMTGTLEFNSATYYRFAAINLDMLGDEHHLGCLTKEDRCEVVKVFCEATIKAIPGARKNTMNANTLPGYVLGVVRETGHPIQLVNAFESPVTSRNGYLSESISRLNAEYQRICETWGIEAVCATNIPAKKVSDFLAELVQYVA